MSRESRSGNNRVKRYSRKALRIPDLGYYVIVTDTKGTERCYFEGLKSQLPKEKRDRLVIKVVETETVQLVEEAKCALRYDPQYRRPWIVFDRDKVESFDRIIKEAEQNGIRVGWSNPCFEIWLFAYFGSLPTIDESKNCCSRFGIAYERYTGCAYDKADKDIYVKIYKSGDEENAISVSKRKMNYYMRNEIRIPSKMCPGTTVFLLVEELRMKAK